MDFNKAEKNYNKRILDQGSDPSRGVQFKQFLECFTGESPPPKTATELRKKVGGESPKARVAFEVLQEALKPAPTSREKPIWYNEVEQSIFQTITTKLDWLWERYDTEVQKLAHDRSQIAEARVNQCQAEIGEMDTLLDEFQQKLSSQEEQLNNYGRLLEESKQKDIRIEKLLTQLSEKESQLSVMSTKIEEFHDTKQDLLLKNAEIDRLNREVKSTSEAHSKLQDSYQQLLKQYGILEGKIEVLSKDKSSINTAIEFARSTDELNSFD